MRLINKLLVSICLFFLFVRCNDPSEIGATFFSNGSLDINYTDTISLNLSTVIIDSLITSNSTRLLVGSHSDQFLGSFKSTPVFQLQSTNTSGLDEDDQFAYLALHLKFDGYSSYDTLKHLRVNVYKLAQELELIDGYLYSSSDYSSSQISLGSVDIVPQPHFVDSLEVKLANSLGYELFNLAQLADSRIVSNEKFVEYFKGLVIVPDDAQQSCFVGLDKSSSMRLYYYDNSSVPAKLKYMEFALGDIYFNQIKSDRSGTYIEQLVTRENDLQSSLTGNLSFIQSGVGLCVKIDFPFLKDVGYTNGDLVVTKAELVLHPVSYLSESNKNGTLDLLNVYVINSSNEIQSSYGIYPTLINNDIYERDIHYLLDVTDFVKAVIKNIDQSGNSLLLTSAESLLNSTIDQVFIGDRDQLNNYKAELRIYYLDIK